MTILKPVLPAGDRPRRRRLKNVPVLPTLLTLGNLLCGFSTIYFCLRATYGVGAAIDPAAVKTLRNEHVERLLPSFLAIGGWCIFLGMVFDAFDGYVARLRRRASQFGVQLDSLADVVTFGVAPAILVIALLTQATHEQRVRLEAAGRDVPAAVVANNIDDTEVGLLSEDRIGRGRWMLLAVYVACAAIRLARFNVETGVEESAHRGFKGLPSPAAAGVVASLVVLREYLAFSRVRHGPTTWTSRGDWIAVALPFVTFAVALLMVSRFDYRHMVNTYLRGRRPIGYVVVALGILALLVFHPEATMAAGFGLYALTGPVRRLVRLWQADPHHGAAPGASSGVTGAGKIA